MIVTSEQEAHRYLPVLRFPLLVIGMMNDYPHWTARADTEADYKQAVHAILSASIAPTRVHAVITSLTGDRPAPNPLRGQSGD